MFNNTETRSIS